MRAVPLARPEHRASLDGSPCDGWDAGSAFLGKRVASSRYRCAVVQCRLAYSCKADVRIPAQAEVATLPINGDVLGPAFRASLGNGQVRCPAVVVQIWFRDGIDESGC